MRALLWVSLMVMGCTVPREPSGRADRTCVSCHGDGARAGDALSQSAPPNDLYGNSNERFLGVGAHQRHLLGGTQFLPVPCATCHPVPEAVLSEGHNDGVTQVIVRAFDGGLAYDPKTQTCSGSACHRVASGKWSLPRSSGEACGSCHGVPPPPPHPRSGECAACHGALDPLTHLDGKVTRVAERCDACHGGDVSGAPPRALDGGTSIAQRGVGAHQAHLSGGAVSKPVSCASCHEVPASVDRHPNGGATEVKPEVGFSADTVSCTNACHGASPVEWSSPGPLTCTGCHGQPPPAPHPQMASCLTCHPAVSAADRGHHVNGVIDVAVPASCDGCHGSAANAAPPRGLDGGTDPSQPGVGAHQAHLVGRGLARPVPCAECHRVPETVRAGGHLDGVTQVVFSGVAVNGALTPSFSSGSCSNSACHDLSAYTNGGPTGGSTASPLWATDAGSITCTSCHGQPPPPPHVARADCQSCHRTEPALHVNGHLDLR